MSGTSAKSRSTSGIACLHRSLVRAFTPAPAARASTVPNTSHASRDESTRVSTNPAAVAAMTSNTSAIKRKRTSILLEPRIIVLLFAAVRQLNQSAWLHHPLWGKGPRLTRSLCESRYSPPWGVLDRDKQLGVVKELTEIVAAAAGDSSLRERTWVLLTESLEGGWGDRRSRQPQSPERGVPPRRPRQAIERR